MIHLFFKTIKFFEQVLNYVPNFYELLMILLDFRDGWMSEFNLKFQFQQLEWT